MIRIKDIKIREDLFSEYYRDTCKISKEDMIAFMEANSKYEMKDSLQNAEAKVVVAVGDKERPIMKKSANKIHQMINGSRLLILPNYYHGDFSINHPREYVDMINELVVDRKKEAEDKKITDIEVNIENTGLPLKHKNKDNSKSLDER